MRRIRYFLILALLAAGLQADTARAGGPVLNVEPQRGIPGQIVEVSGSGFCGERRCSPVTIQFYGVLVADVVTVSAAGRFDREIKVPGGAPTGDVGLVAFQQAADGSDLQAFASFELAVRLRSETPDAKASTAPQASSRPERTSPEPRTSTEATGRESPTPRELPSVRSSTVPAAAPAPAEAESGGATLPVELVATLGGVAAVLLGAVLVIGIRRPASRSR